MKAISSIFGFYYVVGLLRHEGWPRRRSLFNSEAVINSLVLDATIDQMIDWAAIIGACLPNLALQIIATMFRGDDWNNENSFNLDKAVNDSKKRWNDRGNSNPREIVKPIKFSKIDKVISMKVLKSNENRLLLEQYFFESLLWGMANPNIFKIYYETDEKRANEQLPEYKMADIGVDYIPSLDQMIKDAEEIIRGYEKEVRPLSPIPQKLIKDVLSLGVKINN